MGTEGDVPPPSTPRQQQQPTPLLLLVLNGTRGRGGGGMAGGRTDMLLLLLQPMKKSRGVGGCCTHGLRMRVCSEGVGGGVGRGAGRMDGVPSGCHVRRGGGLNVGGATEIPRGARHNRSSVRIATQSHDFSFGRLCCNSFGTFDWLILHIEISPC
jgi:hypothetical protein